jgi:hypothetical protein
MPDLRFLKRCFDVSGPLGFDVVSSNEECQIRGLAFLWNFLMTDN